jgi:pSer/pThr/pTyr-binding forkhead associated (FHA) protein
MQVKLRILKGPNQGKEVKIPTPKCIIGRGEGSHLKAQSDAVSRQHCVIETTEKEVTVRDLQSRNGTLVNDERISGPTTLLSGDILRVGPLEFELIVEVEALVNGKRPVVSGVKDVLERTASGGTSSSGSMDSGKVSKWLEDGDASAKRSPETKQFKLDETDSGSSAIGSPKAAEIVAKAEAEAKLKAEEEAKKKAEADKKIPAKLPTPPAGPTSKNSRDAAGDFLKRMFRK